MIIFYRFKPEYVQKEFFTGGHIEVSSILNSLLVGSRVFKLFSRSLFNIFFTKLDKHNYPCF